MSSSSRKRMVARRWGAAALPLGLLLAASSATAAQYYVQPTADLRAEVDSNRELVTPPVDKRTVEGYSGDVGATWGIATPRSETTIRPQLGYMDYPKADAKSTQELLDMSSSYQSPRSTWNFWGRLDHRDTFNSELASADFDPLNANIPTTPETGRITTDSKRTLATVTPSYQYQVSQRASLGVSGIYESSIYSGSGNVYTSYDYPQVLAFVNWALNQKTRASLGVFDSRYRAKDGSKTVDTQGAELEFDIKRSATRRSSLDFTVQHNKSDSISQPEDSSNAFGATYTTSWQTQTGKLQLNFGRSYTPSGSGGLFSADQFQISYERDLSARLSASIAAHYIRYAALLTRSEGSDYDYVNTTASLNWSMTQRWSLVGGLGYLREKFATATAAANNGSAYVGVSYKGLGRRP